MAVKLITEFGTFTADVDIEYSGKSTSVLPSYATEQGVSINNHRYMKPIEFRIRSLVSTMPLGFSINSFISSITKHFNVRPATFLEALFKVQANAKPFTVVSKFGEFKNMMIADIEWTHSAEQDASMTFDVKFQEFITISRVVDQSEPPAEVLNEGDPSKSAVSASVQTGQVMTFSPSTAIREKVNDLLGKFL